MFEYYRIDVSDGIDINNTSASHKYNVCLYWCFFKINFSYEPPARTIMIYYKNLKASMIVQLFL